MKTSTALLLTRSAKSNNCILPAGKIGRIIDACADAWLVDFGLVTLVRVEYNSRLVRLVQVVSLQDVTL